MARLAITSFAFMLYEVPAPAWKMSRLNSSANLPFVNSRAAFSAAFACFAGISFSEELVLMAASLTTPSAVMKISGAFSLDI